MPSSKSKKKSIKNLPWNLIYIFYNAIQKFWYFGTNSFEIDFRYVPIVQYTAVNATSEQRPWLCSHFIRFSHQTCPFYLNGIIKFGQLMGHSWTHPSNLNSIKKESISRVQKMKGNFDLLWTFRTCLNQGFRGSWIVWFFLVLDKNSCYSKTNYRYKFY